MNTTALTDDQFLARRGEIEERLARITELEAYLASRNASYLPKSSDPSPQSAEDEAPTYKRQRAPPKPFDPSRYSTRLIALKFAYLGARYNGFEHHSKNLTPLPTIEEVLWKALKKTRLISPTPKEGLGKDDVNWEGCEYSKCGRTDRGVSAFGQVIGIRVRSIRPLEKKEESVKAADGTKGEAESVSADVERENADGLPGMGAADASVWGDEPVPFDDVKDELPYVRILNHNLPEDIRVLAWCPNPPPGFDARFSCRERRYKYFFTNPAFAPMPGSNGLCKSSPAANGGIMREGRLDIKAMREAAGYLIGLHDFRNLCKVDASKQIDNFMRRITHASIDEVNAGSGFAKYTSEKGFHLPAFGSGAEVSKQEPNTASKGPALYTFTLYGTAFLWHQVRHIVAILFLVGQGLEHPTLIKDLLDMEKNPTKPKYEMASDTPLVLWDCIFPGPGADEKEGPMQDTLDWVYAGDAHAAVKGSGLEEKFGNSGVVTDLWNLWHERKIDEVLAGSLLDVVAGQGPKFKAELDDETPIQRYRSVRVFGGGNAPKLQGQYVPVLKKERMDPIEVINERYAIRKGLTPKEAVPARQSDEADE